LTHVKTKARLAIVLDENSRWSKAPMSYRQMLVAAVKEHQIPFGSDQWKVSSSPVKGSVMMFGKRTLRLCIYVVAFYVVQVAFKTSVIDFAPLVVSLIWLMWQQDVCCIQVSKRCQCGEASTKRQALKYSLSVKRFLNEIDLVKCAIPWLI